MPAIGHLSLFGIQKKQGFRLLSASERTIIEMIMIQTESLTHGPIFTSRLIHPKLIPLPAASISALFMPVRTNPPQCQPDTAYDNPRLSVWLQVGVSALASGLRFLEVPGVRRCFPQIIWGDFTQTLFMPRFLIHISDLMIQRFSWTCVECRLWLVIRRGHQQVLTIMLRSPDMYSAR